MSAKDATCLNEMANLMTCWKEHEFKDTACAQEIKAFIACTAQVAAVGYWFIFYLHNFTLQLDVLLENEWI